MPGRGRRVALALILLALVLSTGRWGAEFLTERLWEASVSESVAVAGARRGPIGRAPGASRRAGAAPAWDPPRGGRGGGGAAGGGGGGGGRSPPARRERRPPRRGRAA